MTPRSSLDTARQTNWLWPTVADALDTYLRRKSRGADGYELVWRLIHVWEAVVITLAGAASARFREESRTGADFRKCREFLYGKVWSATDEFRIMQGALDGSIDRWIDILNFVATKAEPTHGTFVSSLKEFLTMPCIQVSPLLTEWRRACDVPSVETDSRLSVLQACRLVNTFRNRFAHVPFPHDVIGAVATSLERVTVDMFDAPRCNNPEEKNNRAWYPGGALTGAFAERGTLLRGSQPLESHADLHELNFVFTPEKNAKTLERWGAAPFIYIDSMERPYVLTRWTGPDRIAWDFTRFRAEANSILTIDQPEWLNLVPVPAEKEYRKEQQAEGDSSRTAAVAETSESSSPDYGEALRARQAEDYDRAISILTDYTELHPRYHPGWYNLGLALRGRAIQMEDPKRKDERLRLLDQSIKAFEKAAEHIDDDYKASALYELSKSEFRLYDLGDDQALERARRQVERAVELSPEDRFLSWREYLDRRRPQEASG